MNRFALLLFLVLSFGAPQLTFADAISDIQAQIQANNQQLDALKAEIASYQKELDALGPKKDTLQSAISSLTISQKQLTAQIKATENKIASANLEIRELTNSIGDKEETIAENQTAIGKALRIVAQDESASLVTTLISSDTFSDAWHATDVALQFNRALRDDIASLRAVRTELSTNRDAVTKEKTKLVALQSDLAVQKKSVEVSKAAQQKLLADTKNQESAYQKILAQKRTQQTEFENQLFRYEEQLRQALDPSSVPFAHSGILFPPLAQTTITQYFGKTVDAIRLYVSGTHGGVDFKASIGTPVKAALMGMVLDTESVQVRSGCQYGKWVLIKHANGLSTIYGHLSYVYVHPGDTVSTGQVIGLSGDTGYAYGPHLHFGVYNTTGIKVVDAGALGSVRCAGIKTVAASPTAYLNPLSYL